MPKTKDKGRSPAERLNVQFSRRFNLDSANGQLFSWMKEAYPDWVDLVCNAAREMFWPVYLASKGASSEELARARQTAIATFAARLDLFLGDVPLSAGLTLTPMEPIAVSSPSVVPVEAEAELETKFQEEEIEFEEPDHV